MRRYWLIFPLALVVRLALAWQPLEWLLTHCTADDAFYYLTIAKRAAAGEGITFDGIERTNGFHPLYLALLVLLARLIQSKALLLHAALTLLAVTDAATSVVLARIAHRLLSARWAWLVGVTWALNPSVVFGSASGVEAPLAVLLLMTTVHYALAWRDEGPSRPTAWAWGGLLGLTFLARTDTALFAIGLLVALGLRSRARAVDAAMAAVVVVLPWLLWNRLVFGTWVQSSGSILVFRAHSRLWLETATPPTAWAWVEGGAANLWRFIKALSTAFGAGPMGWLFLLVGSVGAALSWPHQRRPSSWPVFGLALGLVGYVIFYGLYFWHFQWWYTLLPIASLWLFAALGMAGWCDGAMTRHAARRAAWAVATAGVWVVLTGTAWTGRLGVEWYPWQSAYLVAARDLTERVAPLVRVGAFNAGIFGYFSDRTVVNLDGVVNNSVADALRRRQLAEYLEERDIQLLLDHRGVIDLYHLWSTKDFARKLYVVQEYDTAPSAGNVVLARVTPTP